MPTAPASVAAARRCRVDQNLPIHGRTVPMAESHKATGRVD
jgi:hypothetical protein